MKKSIMLLAGAAIVAPAAAAQVRHTAPAVHVAQSDSRRLAQLFHDCDEATLRRNPIQALFRGDLRYADRFGDYITDAYYAGERAAAQADLAALAHINRARLTPEERISYDVFKWQRKLDLRGFQPA